MFQFRRFPIYDYFIHHRLLELHSNGFPHSEIHGSMAAFASPWLFADCCVLRRLLVPRHSPCALCSLTIPYVILFLVSFGEYCFIQSFLFKDFFSSHLLYYLCSVFKVQPKHFCFFGGLKWTRTTDLTLIRRAL